MTPIIIISVISIVGVITLGIFIASCQNRIINDCLDRKRKHDKLLIGKLNVHNIPDSELISLSRPMFTHIGMGGLGPCYNPSFTVLCLVVDELTSRRSKRLIEL